MRKACRRAVLMGMLISAALLTVLGAAQLAGVRINTSNSIPKGVYWLTNRPVAVGEYVIFCPPNTRIFQEARARGYIQPGFCHGGFGHMMKHVAAIAGDTVSTMGSGVWVNGVRLPYSHAYALDGHGRSLPSWISNHYTLKRSELLLMTDQSARSFDARYFGVLNQTHVQAVIRPLITFPSRTHTGRT